MRFLLVQDINDVRAKLEGWTSEIATLNSTMQALYNERRKSASKFEILKAADENLKELDAAGVNVRQQVHNSLQAV